MLKNYIILFYIDLLEPSYTVQIKATGSSKMLLVLGDCTCSYSKTWSNKYFIYLLLHEEEYGQFCLKTSLVEITIVHIL